MLDFMKLINCIFSLFNNICLKFFYGFFICVWYELGKSRSFVLDKFCYYFLEIGYFFLKFFKIK